jgi:branched-chain amino acid aminotransferase
MAHHCYFNGTILPAEETRIHITDLGLLRGYGLFDYFRTYNGKPFQWDWYWERYTTSAELLGIPNPLEKDTARQVVQDLIDKSGLPDCAIRFVLTGGYAADSISMTQPNLMIISEDIHPVADPEYQTGIKVLTYDFVRDIPTIKSIDYKHLMILMPKLKAQGAADVLFHHEGRISELSRSNVFIIQSGKLITPHRDILFGITRKTVLSLADGWMPVEERDITVEECLAADEIFTTSTTKKVLPITQIDDHSIGSGQIGPVTQILLDKINAMVIKW